MCSILVYTEKGTETFCFCDSIGTAKHPNLQQYGKKSAP